MDSGERINRVLGHISQNEECKTAVPAPTSASRKRPIKVVVTGAAGNICYSILFMIGQGRMLGPDQPIELRLLDIPPMAKKIKGVEMELRDCAFPVFTSIVSTTDYAVAFKDVEIALLIGAKPRGPGMERKDLLQANANIFAGQGKALNQYASRNVKVCVVGNPANTNALIASENAPRIPKENFTAMTRLDQNRAMSQIASRVQCGVDNVKNLIIWGNHSSTQYPDVNHAYIKDAPTVGYHSSVRSIVGDDEWLNGKFLTTVQKRGAAIIAARGSSSAASAANAAVDHIRSWFLGTPRGEWVSMGVPSDGSYGIPKGIIYSFPVTAYNGSYKIVQGLKIDAFSRQKMDATAKELLEEKAQALGK